MEDGRQNAEGTRHATSRDAPRRGDRHWQDPFETGAGRVYGSSYDHPDRTVHLASAKLPEVSLVLYDHDDPEFARWQGSGSRTRYRYSWPRLTAPPDIDELARVLLALQSATEQGDVVEISCFGGHGRTGTVLACLAVLSGENPADAISRVRDEYCARAISTEDLEGVVHDIATFRPE